MKLKLSRNAKIVGQKQGPATRTYQHLSKSLEKHENSCGNQDPDTERSFKELLLLLSISNNLFKL